MAQTQLMVARASVENMRTDSTLEIMAVFRVSMRACG
jgi:hypothetical protein